MDPYDSVHYKDLVFKPAEEILLEYFSPSWTPSDTKWRHRKWTWRNNLVLDILIIPRPRSLEGLPRRINTNLYKVVRPGKHLPQEIMKTRERGGGGVHYFPTYGNHRLPYINVLLIRWSIYEYLLEIPVPFCSSEESHKGASILVVLKTSTDKYYSLDSEDDFCSGCRNVSHQQQLFSWELPSLRRSHNTNYWYSWVQTIYYPDYCLTLLLTRYVLK